MKRILTLLILALMATPLSAQLLISDDFEDGTYDKWKVWKDQKNEMAESVNAYEGAHAYQIKFGTFLTLRETKANSRYQVTLFARSLEPKSSAKVAISRYDVGQKKMVAFLSEFIELTDQYKLFSFTFDTKKQVVTHRVVLFPVADSGPFIVDNVVVEQIHRDQ